MEARPIISSLVDGSLSRGCLLNLAKFRRQPRDEELPSKDEIIGLASIAVPPSDPLEHYLLDHENDMFMNERREIDEVFFK